MIKSSSQSIWLSWFTGDANPSPNSYTLPVLLGPRIPNRPSSACYSLSSRPKIGGIDMDYAKTPGPGRYGVPSLEMYQKKPPSYSIIGRTFMPGGENVSKNHENFSLLEGVCITKQTVYVCSICTVWLLIANTLSPRPLPCMSAMNAVVIKKFISHKVSVCFGRMSCWKSDTLLVCNDIVYLWIQVEPESG